MRGHAVVAYEPSFDPEQLNQAVSFIHTSVSSGLGLLPGGFAAAAASIGASTIVGITDSYENPMTIKDGPIAGSMRNGRLSLDWAGKKPEGLPFDVDFTLIGGSQRITSGKIPVRTSWPGQARVQNGMAVGTIQASPPKADGVEKKAQRLLRSPHRTRAAEPRVADRPACPAQRAPAGSSSTRNAWRL